MLTASFLRRSWRRFLRLGRSPELARFVGLGMMLSSLRRVAQQSLSGCTFIACASELWL